MTTYAFQSDPSRRHQVLKRGSLVRVDGADVPLRALDPTHYVTQAGAHVRVSARGDTVYLQLCGRVCVIERIDATRSGASGGAAAQGSATAPMPGVVVSWIAQPGDSVKARQPLLVIESMKLQMTIEAPQDGILASLPCAPGQTFQRGAVLAHVGVTS
jgi:3-methylcrotonyl-CoA carboxylase alpha subunit